MRRDLLGRVVAIAALLLIFLIVLSQAVIQSYHRDEHQFITPGALLAAHGLLPYRDYPYFHMPNVAFFYGALFRVFEHRLLAARVLSAVFAWGTVALILWHANRTMLRAKFALWARYAVLAAFAILCTGASLFAQAVGFAWNHAIPVFFVLAGFLLQLAASHRERARGLLFVSGMALGFATGTRISFAPLAAPLLLSILLFPRFALRERVLSIVLVGCGLFVSLLPSFYFLARHPQQFLFGNFSYPKLATVWREYPADHPDIATLVDPERGLIDPGKQPPPRPIGEKFEDFFKKTFVRNLPVFLLFGLIGLPLCLWQVLRRSRAPTDGTRGSQDAWLFFLVLPFVLWGCFAPPRHHVQYMYALLPFIFLSVMIGLTGLDFARWPARLVVFGTIVCGVWMVPRALESYAPVRSLFSPPTWGTLRVHGLAEEMRERLAAGASDGANAGPGTAKVLTLSPILPLEGGLDIYPGFATGPFAWRSAHVVPAAKRRAMGVVSPFELESFLDTDPPRAIFLEPGAGRDNKPMEEYAGRHGYTRERLGGGVLWVAPGTTATAR